MTDGRNSRAREQVRANSRGIQKLRERLSRLSPEPLIAIWESLGQADYRPVLSRITVQTLLIYGGESNYYSVETAHYVRQSIPGSRLFLFEEADHAPHIYDRGRFLTCVRDFLKE
ncbi:hypothetical protein CCP2SC5_950016 [Azospirillaceae bacterium]